MKTPTIDISNIVNNVYDDRKVYFTSDTHFSSDRVLELSRRPFSSVEEMDNFMITEWNKLVKPDDIVFHLGDFGNYEIREKLNGKIYLILGNYEDKDIENGKITLEDLTNKYKFDYVRSSVYLKTDEAYNSTYLVHDPGRRREVLLKSHRYSTTFTLFGHIHGLQMVKQHALNVGVDCHYFKPIEYKDVMFYKNAIDNIYDSSVFCP